MRVVLPVVLVAAAVPVVFVAATSSRPAAALENGLARTPQMGWNNWNAFGCNVTDSLIRQTADALVSSGMAAVGYEYVNIDDCWSTRSRNSAGDLVPDPVKFPNGIKALADYVHSRGLKIGIYSSAGLTTCAGYPASLNNEVRDARLWASWGIDYLKYDNCGDHLGRNAQTRYTAMRDALLATGRPILYSLCNWGQESVWTWGPAVGNSWRNTGDIVASWSSVMGILDSQVGRESYSRPGAWNDPDMLEVGQPGLSDTESRAHFSLWSILNAPLLAGNDLRSMSATTRAILTNTEVIGVNQDWGGRQGHKISDNGNLEVWRKPMSNGSAAVVLLNRGTSTTTVSTTAAALGLGAAASYTVRDLWARTTTTSGSTISASVPSHGAAMFIVSGGSTVTPPTTRPTTPPTTPPTTGPTTGPGTTSALRGVGSNRCLDVIGANQANGARLNLWDCNNQTNQRWTSTATGELRVYANKCLDTTGTTAGTAVQIWDCGGQPTQRWTVNGDGTIRNTQTNLCLDASGAGTANGTPIILWNCAATTNQRWTRV